jgi:hypothetical protein
LIKKVLLQKIIEEILIKKVLLLVKVLSQKIIEEILIKKVLLQKIIEEILIKKFLLHVKGSLTENYRRNLDQKGSFTRQSSFT